MTVLVSDREGSRPYIAYPEGRAAQSVERAEQVAPLERVLLCGTSRCRSRRTWRAVHAPPSAEASAPVRRRGARTDRVLLDTRAGTRIPPHTGVTNTP